jgi:ArsR family metal-binding transcriptional regulator
LPQESVLKVVNPGFWKQGEIGVALKSVNEVLLAVPLKSVNDKSINEILLTMVNENIISLYPDGNINMENLTQIISSVISNLGLGNRKNKSLPEDTIQMKDYMVFQKS